MVQPLNYLKETASQTAGPYVHIGLLPRQAGFDIFANNLGEMMVGPKTKGERVIIEGRVIDGAGAPLKDALIEIWQANAAGRYNHPADRQAKPIDDDFRGWGRSGCDFESGRYCFRTIKPGAVVGRSGHRPMAPHVNLWIVARGINIGLSTRMYFGDEEAANAADPVLNIIEPALRRKTLIGQRQMRDQDVVYSFDIYLQGERETVFFDI
jgi:protocatechuate 3,4-dioxygenase, alpha subunit